MTLNNYKLVDYFIVCFIPEFNIDKKPLIYYFAFSLPIYRNQMKHLYYNSNNNLNIENVDLASLSNKYATPFYIYSSAEIIKNCREILSIGGSLEILPCYALKANFNPTLLKIIVSQGFGVDVVSGGELFFARKSGVPPDKIVFAGVGKTEKEIEEAVKQGIHSLNIESESELDAVAKIAHHLNKNVVIAIRVNPDIDAKTHPYISTGLHSNKFGVARATALKLYQKAHSLSHIEPTGIHVHIGSQIQTVDPYLATVSFLKNFISDLKKSGIEITHIDLGGGIGIDYQNQYNPDGMPRTYIKEILPGLLEPLRNENKKVLIELGRSIIGSAGLLITKVLYIKNSPQKKFIIVNAAMNNLIRPSLYNAYHQILPVFSDREESEIVDIVGPVCESSDFFAHDRLLPVIKEGDYLAISGVGAYGQALSSNYNLRPMIAEYLVEGDQHRTIFKGESIQDIAEKYNQ